MINVWPGWASELFYTPGTVVIHGGRLSAKSDTVSRYLVHQWLGGSVRYVLCLTENAYGVGGHPCIQDVEAQLENGPHECPTLARVGHVITRRKDLGVSGAPDIRFSSVKSVGGDPVARADLIWVDNAQQLTEGSMIRLFGSVPGVPAYAKTTARIILTMNPTFDTDPAYRDFCTPDPRRSARVIEVSWRDNPWLTPEQQATREEDERDLDPEQYAHVWEGKLLRKGGYG